MIDVDEVLEDQLVVVVGNLGGDGDYVADLPLHQ